MKFEKNEFLVIGLLLFSVILRAIISLLFVSQPLNIVDEQHYNKLALSILERGEFAWAPGKLTAIRPPLYPVFLAMVYKIFGAENYNVVRVIQVLLSLLSGLLVYSLTQKTFREERIALLAAMLFLFYPTLVIFNYLILTETLFIFLFLLALWFLMIGLNLAMIPNGLCERSEVISEIAMGPSVPRDDRDKIASGPAVPCDDKGEAGARNDEIADEIATAAVRPRDDSFFVIASERERAKQSLLRAKRSNYGSSRPLARPHYDKLFLLFAGVFWGLASLTRSVTYPLAPLVGLFLILIWPKKRQGLIAAAIFVTVVGLTLSPWIVRNYRVFGHFVAVDTMGGLNLYMGNYEHTPLHRAWAAVDNPPQIAWYRGHEKELRGLNEAEKQRWAIKKALEFMKKHPMLTALRTLIKTANFWQLERTIIAGMQKGYFPGISNKLVKILIALSIITSYTFIVIFGFCGLLWILTKWRILNGECRIHCLFVLIIFYFTAIHAIVFGHSRYHLPLIPLLCIYASYLLVHFREIWRDQRKPFCCIFVSVCLIFGCFWAYDIFVGSKEKVMAFLQVIF